LGWCVSKKKKDKHHKQQQATPDVLAATPLRSGSPHKQNKLMSYSNTPCIFVAPEPLLL
jgi:hypothetical protein